MQSNQIRVAIDLVVFSLAGGELCVLLGRRPRPPYPRFHALPGEFRKPGVSVDDHARDLLMRTTGLERAWVEQLRTFDRPERRDEDGALLVPGRDPRGDVVSVAYLAVVSADNVTTNFGGNLGWQSVRRLPQEIAFDHREITDYAVRRLRSKLGYSSLGFELLPEELTIPELQAMYEQVLGISLNRGNFWRRVLDAGVIEETERTRPARGRPAKLYRFTGRAFGLFEAPDEYIGR
ncbi:MAG: NUDIX hydrolase [Chloroflexota bacterium]|nr:NUDIX hydrolase [Chloroflexota bacterium]